MTDFAVDGVKVIEGVSVGLKVGVSVGVKVEVGVKVGVLVDPGELILPGEPLIGLPSRSEARDVPENVSQAASVSGSLERRSIL